MAVPFQLAFPPHPSSLVDMELPAAALVYQTTSPNEVWGIANFPKYMDRGIWDSWRPRTPTRKAMLANLSDMLDTEDALLRVPGIQEHHEALRKRKAPLARRRSRTRSPCSPRRRSDNAVTRRRTYRASVPVWTIECLFCNRHYLSNECAPCPALRCRSHTVLRAQQQRALWLQRAGQ